LFPLYEFSAILQISEDHFKTTIQRNLSKAIHQNLFSPIPEKEKNSYENPIEKREFVNYNGGKSMAKNMKPLQELDLLDRFLFAVAMEDPVIQKNILEILLEKQIHLLQQIETEKEFRTSPLRRSIRVDVYSKDDENNIYNAEAQKQNKGNHPKRSRYYQALLDSSLLEPGVKDFNMIPNVTLIQIAPFDLFGKKKCRYTFRMKCDEVEGLALEDGAVRIFFNTHGEKEEGMSDELMALLHYIEHTTEENADQSESEKIQEIHKRIQNIKKNEEVGVRYMQAWEELAYEREEGYEDGRKIGRSEGRLEERKEGIQNLIEALRACQIPDDTIVEQLMEKYDMMQEEARRAVEK
jgi:predicted transposase/invertase (TIGR01784 family)